MARVLVTDGDKRSSLAIVRSLGRAGHSCVVAARWLPTLAGASRHCDARVAFDFADLSRVAGTLEELIVGRGVDLVIPTTDDALTCLLEAFPSGRVAGARIAAGSPEAYEALSDKARLLELARELGVTVPESLRVESASDVAAAVREMGLPCVLKPHRSVVLVDGRTEHLYVRFARSPEEADEIAGSYPAAAFPILVQEPIVGPGEGVFLLYDGQQTLAASAHRRIREYPPSGGASTYRESVPVAADLLRVAEDLMARTGWEGLAMVEFKRSTAEGKAYLMEVNARPWGSLQLAIDSGVDYPRMMADHFLTPGPPPSYEYRIGTRTRWFWGDFEWALSQLAAPPVARTPIGTDAPRSRWLELASLLRVRLHPLERIEEFRWSDPGPFFFELRREFRRHVLSRLGRRRKR